MATQTTKWTFAFRPNGDVDETNAVVTTVTEASTIALAAGDWEVCSVVHDDAGTPTYYWTGSVVTVADQTDSTDQPSAGAGTFVAAALKVLKINAVDNKRTVSDGTASVTITEYDTDSTINGTSLTGGGIVDESDVPTFLSGDVFINWIIKQPANELIGHNSPLTFAPGSSKCFLFDGQVFEFAHGRIGAASCTIRWSNDGGKTWLQAYTQWDYNVDKKWIQVDFGSAAPRVVEVICEDQGLQTYGFNFDTGDTPPAPFIDFDVPLIQAFGDSYVFGQGSGDFGNGIDEHPNNQRATSGMARKMSEYIGGLQVFPHGLRSNGFAAQYKPTPKQSNYADRIKCPTIPEFSEGSLYGPLDLIVMPSTINDDVPGADMIRRESAAAAFVNMRELQPDALILFPVGARAPQFGERDAWLDDYKNGFNDVFGATEAEHIANGAYLHDGSRRDGANWTPEGTGVEGSNPHFGVSAPIGDPGHPTALGHDFLGQRYAEGAVILAKKVTVASAAAGDGTDIYTGSMNTVGQGWTETEAPVGVYAYDAVGADTALNWSSPDIDGTNVYVISFTVTGLASGGVFVRLGNGVEQTVDQNGDYAFAFNDAAQSDFTIGGNDFTGTISNIGCRKMT